MECVAARCRPFAVPKGSGTEGSHDFPGTGGSRLESGYRNMSSLFKRALPLVLAGLLGSGFAVQQNDKGRVTINNACRVYHPTCVNAKIFQKVAVVTSRKFFDATPEYKQIARRKLKPNTAEWCFLAKAASDKFRVAIEKVAKGGGYDLIAEHGAITVTGLDVVDVTSDLLSHLPAE